MRFSFGSPSWKMLIYSFTSFLSASLKVAEIWVSFSLLGLNLRITSLWISSLFLLFPPLFFFCLNCHVLPISVDMLNVMSLSKGKLVWSKCPIPFRMIETVVVVDRIFCGAVPIGNASTKQYSEHLSVTARETVGLQQPSWEFCWQGWCQSYAICGHVDLHYSLWYYCARSGGGALLIDCCVLWCCAFAR